MTDFSTQRRPPPRYRDIFLVAGGVCAILLAGSGALRARGFAVAMRARSDEAARSLAEAKARVRRLEGETASGAEQALAARVVLAAQAPPAAVLSALGQVQPADVRLDSLTLAYEKELRVEMHVAARGPAAYADFLARLAASPHFQDVVPGAENRDDGLTATVQARFRGGAR